MVENAVSNSFQPLGWVSLSFSFPFCFFLVAFHSFTVLMHCTFIHSVLSILYNVSTSLLHLHFLCDFGNGWSTHVQIMFYVPFVCDTVIDAAT